MDETKIISKKNGTPHITAKPGDFADTVLMPGDPLRSKFIAEKYLDNPVLVNNVRGVNGYTGTYKGKRVSVMASGMGQPSIGLYSYELFNFYDVKSIIRVGSTGTISPDLHVGDLVLAMGACTTTNFDFNFHLPGKFCPIADYDLLSSAVNYCKDKNYKFKVGNVVTSDFYYYDKADDAFDWQKMNVLAIEMEAAALYMTAARAKKKALCILTVSDSFVNPNENMTPEDRETSFTSMIDTALNIA